MKKLIATLVCLAVCTSFYLGITFSSSAKTERRFEKIYRRQAFKTGGGFFSVFIDKETGVEYLLYKSGMSVAMCKLEKKAEK